jgi:hypothetical protein
MGKFQAGNRYATVIKVLERIPSWRRGISGKTPACEQEWDWFKRILWEFRAGKGNIWENFRLYKGNIFPDRKSLVSDPPAGEGKTVKPYFTVYETSVNQLNFTVEHSK